MALPDGFLDELRNRISIAQVAGRKVVWDSRKSNPAKGDYWAPCPFHQEKTASFHVDDKKGFYYCFGCHQKGDALTFVRETENMGFMDAVELLAGEAGMQMPAQDPAAAARAARGKTLAEVMELAVQFTRLQLAASAGQAARDYLDTRGLSEATRKRFEIGFAPDSRTAMTQALAGKGVPIEDIVAAGLAIQPDDGSAPYNRFRGRIMFPIRDARNRPIAFGGRAMDPGARAKYLNSPETSLFDKGRALYNIGPAREASGKTGKLVVCEGYMDVIALAQAGIDHAVAPLGTAVTEDQLQMMWRVCPEPVIALDGDTAGLRAAHRVIDVALPLLEAGKALRFCLIPEGLDPDDLIRAEGASAMQALLDDALPMVALLWQRETEGHVFDSPERRAALDARLRGAIGQLRDPSLQGHYRDALKTYRQDLFRPANSGKPKGNTFRPGGTRRPAAPAGPTPGARQSLLAQQATASTSAARIRESAILLAAFNHITVAEALEAELDATRFLCHDLDALRLLLLQCLAATPHGASQQDSDPLPPLRSLALSRSGQDPVPALLRIGQVRANPHLGEEAAPTTALFAVREELAKHRAASGIEAELREAEVEISGVADEGLTWRLQQASEAVDSSQRAAAVADDSPQDESDDLSKGLQSLIDAEIWLKKRR